jgi:hypothetical protein
MYRFTKKIYPIIFILFALMAGCSEEKSPVDPDSTNKNPDQAPPENVIGVMNAIHPVPSILLLWTQGSSKPDSGYNVYRQKGGGAFEKLNDSPVKFIMFIEYPIMIIMGYNDETLDPISSDRHLYYLTSISTSGEESAGSDTVSITPSETYIHGDINGLYPNGHANVDIVPTFSWAPVNGATSYLLHMSGWLYWHQSSITEIILGDEAGVSYFDKLPDSLDCGRTYTWAIFAMNDDNCAIAEGNAKFTTMVRTLVDRIDEAGYHCVWWDQLDDQGKQVPAGSYVALIRIDQSFVRVGLVISNAAPPVNAICDPPAGVPPSMSLSSPASEWPPGEHVLLEYGIPAAAQVQIEIMRDVP